MLYKSMLKRWCYKTINSCLFCWRKHWVRSIRQNLWWNFKIHIRCEELWFETSCDFSFKFPILIMLSKQEWIPSRCHSSYSKVWEQKTSRNLREDRPSIGHSVHKYAWSSQRQKGVGTLRHVVASQWPWMVWPLSLRKASANGRIKKEINWTRDGNHVKSSKRSHQNLCQLKI